MEEIIAKTFKKLEDIMRKLGVETLAEGKIYELKIIKILKFCHYWMSEADRDTFFKIIKLLVAFP